MIKKKLTTDKMIARYGSIAVKLLLNDTGRFELTQEELLLLKDLNLGLDGDQEMDDIINYYLENTATNFLETCSDDTFDIFNDYIDSLQSEEQIIFCKLVQNDELTAHEEEVLEKLQEREDYEEYKNSVFSYCFKDFITSSSDDVTNDLKKFLSEPTIQIAKDDELSI